MKAKKLQTLLSIGTALPAVLLSGPAPASPSEFGWVVAQIAPAEDPQKRRPQDEGGTLRPAGAPARPAAAPAPNRPAPAPNRPAARPVERHAPPAAARPAAPPATRPVGQTAPTHKAPPSQQTRPAASPAPTEAAPHVGRPATPSTSAPRGKHSPTSSGQAPRVERPASPPASAPQGQRPLAPTGQAPRVDRPATPPVATPPVAAPQGQRPATPTAPTDHARPTAPLAPTVPVAPTAPPPAATAPQQPLAAPSPTSPVGVRPTGPAAVPPQLERPRPSAPGDVGAPPQPFPPRSEAPQRGPERNGVGAAVGAAAVGAAVGIVGGMMLGGSARSLDEVHQDRRETVRDGATFYSEPGRVIIRDADGLRVRHDEAERFRDLGGPITRERRDGETWDIWQRPDGARIVTVTDEDGRLVRRIRRWPDGREDVLLDDGPRRTIRSEVIVLPPPPVPRERWAIDSEGADESVIYDTLDAPPLAPLPRRYGLDQIRSSRDLRAYMPAVDVDTITFATGSWTVEPSQISRLEVIARSIARIVERNPAEIFLIEGHTDAVGSDVDNLSLSDRRAQSVATILSRDFRIPAENLVTQGYGEQFLKEATDGPSRINRRVTVRRITPLLERGAR